MTKTMADVREFWNEINAIGNNTNMVIVVLELQKRYIKLGKCIMEEFGLNADQVRALSPETELPPKAEEVLTEFQHWISENIVTGGGI